MNYELYMGAALAEARAAASSGERPDGAVAVLDDAMVARAQEQVVASGDPTAHAVMIVLREAARRLGRTSLGGLTVFSTSEPCAMCVGAMLASDADALVFAQPDPHAGAAGSAIQLARNSSLPQRLHVVSGILQAEAAELQRSAVRA
ncbi:MAG TPA: nucleoside deaminase [Candidatus Limnocylindria bacterium]|nr:nucleoside deaminase [Candidatus Limnocylindria bacterium]